MKRFILAVFMVIVFGLAVSVNASLIDNSLINPLDLTVTQIRSDGSRLMWLKNANRSGFISSWDKANNFISSLNSSNYMGYHDWRLPHTLPVNGTSYNYNWSTDGSTDWGYNITSLNSELGYMYYVELGNKAYISPGWTENLEAGPFETLKNHAYWSGNEYAPDPGNVWVFTFNTGGQYAGSGHSAWAVRDDNASVCPIINVSSTSADGLYKAGDIIPISVTFKNIVTVTGTPQLTLETGEEDAIVVYTNGSGTNTLIFNYAVSPGHESLDLDYISSNALVLNNGTIKDELGENTPLNLPPPGATWSSSLGANKAIVVDAIPPRASIASGPPLYTNTSAATITIGGSDVTQYKYKLDDGIYSGASPRTSDIVLTNLSDGNHIVYIIGLDEAGNWQSEEDATDITWTVDTIPPTITGLSDDTIPIQSKTWEWDSTDVNSTMFRYMIDQNGAWSHPSGDYSDIKTATKGGGDGIWYLHVQAIDAAGNESVVVTVLAVLDNTAPTATISGTPSSPTNSTDATLTVSGNDVVAYKYKLNDGNYSDETDLAIQITLSALFDGTYTVFVIGKDTAGKWQEEINATSTTWIVDTVAPTAGITIGPLVYTNINSTTIIVGGDDVIQYKYKLDDGIYGDAILVTDEISLNDLSEGTHTVYIIGCDPANNWQSEEDGISTTWTVDLTFPNADAGPDQIVDEGVTVTLNGLNSFDTVSGIASYLWEQIIGTSVTLSDSNVAQPTFYTHDVGPDGESLTFRLTVTNNAGSQSTDTCIVNISWVNIAPTANAGFDQSVVEEGIVTLDGTNSADLDDGITSFYWEQKEGSLVNLSDSNAVQPTFSALNVTPDGVALTFQLKVTDNGGLQATDTCIVNITGDNDPPIANAGDDQEVEEGGTVTLDGSNSFDPDDGIHRYLWSQTSGIPITFSDTTVVQPTFVTPPVGLNGTQVKCLLIIIDNGGLQHTDEVTIDIIDNGITDFPDDVLSTESATEMEIGIKTESGGTVIGFSCILPDSIPDAINKPDDLIYGLIDIQAKPDIIGGTVKLTVFLAYPAPENYTWHKYDTTKGWYDFSTYAKFNDDRDQVTLTLTDGGPGDDDGIANGIIRDPSGLGYRLNEENIESDQENSSSSSSGGGGGCFLSIVKY